MSTLYDYDDNGTVTEQWEDGVGYTIDEIEEKITQASSAMFKKLMELSMIEDYINDELTKKRIWCLRKQKHTITHEDIDFIMNKATNKEIDTRIAELTMELAND